jgi:predicted nuclease with TOPRIM domain
VHQTVAIARAQLADLMAELEAGARFVDRIERDASALDDRLRTNLHQRDEMERLIGRLGELRDSLTQQRTLMIQLRGCFDVLRRALTTRL